MDFGLSNNLSESLYTFELQLSKDRQAGLFLGFFF
jgi:hypothetical protein